MFFASLNSSNNCNKPLTNKFLSGFDLMYTSTKCFRFSQNASLFLVGQRFVKALVLNLKTKFSTSIHIKIVNCSRLF